MKVIIDDVEYVPKDSVRIEVHGVRYNSIEHWLFNIHAQLINKWVNEYKEGTVTNKETLQEITDFENFVEKHLGFKYNEDKAGFIEL